MVMYSVVRFSTFLLTRGISLVTKITYRYGVQVKEMFMHYKVEIKKINTFARAKCVTVEENHLSGQGKNLYHQQVSVML